MATLVIPHRGRIGTALLFVFVVFLALRLDGTTSWSWWLVLSPLLADLVLGLTE